MRRVTLLCLALALPRVAHAQCGDAGGPFDALVDGVEGATAFVRAIHFPSAPPSEIGHESVDDLNNVISNIATPFNIAAEAGFGMQFEKVNHPAQVVYWDLPGKHPPRRMMEINTAFGRPAKGIDSAFYLVQLPTNFFLMWRYWDEARKTGSPQAWNSFVYWGATLGATALAGGLNGLQAVDWVVSHRMAYSAAAKAFRGVAPEAKDPVVRAAARKAAKQAVHDASLAEGSSRNLVRNEVRGAAMKAFGEDSVANAMGATGRTAGRALLRDASKEAGDAAIRAAARAGAKALGKAALRFVPGVNAAIAACDVAVMVATFRDPNAGAIMKASSVGVALGSVVAATNIPVISQVGGAFSLASSMVPVAASLFGWSF